MGNVPIPTVTVWKHKIGVTGSFKKVTISLAMADSIDIFTIRVHVLAESCTIDNA